MSTGTDPHLRLPAARPVDSPTARTPAVISPAVVRDYADEYRPPSPPLAAEPGPEVEPYPDGWATSALSAHAQRLHAWCGCDWAGDVEGHGGVDFELEAARDRAQIIGEALDAGEVVHPGAVKAPVETKVAVGGYTGILAALVLAVTTAGLQQTDTFRQLLGDNPWSGPAVLAVGVVLTAAQSWAAYQAPHSPRPGSPESA